MKRPDTDIAVVGAGVVGLCCAIALQRAGYRVVLIDRDGVGEGCSKGNAGHFATEQVLPLATPGLLGKIPGMLLDPLGPVSIRWSYLHRIAPWLIRFMLNTRQRPFAAGAQALQSLNQGALAAWQRLLEEVDATDMLRVEGSLLVFEQQQTLQGYQPTLAQLRQHGVQAQLLSGDQVRELEPQLAGRIEHGVLFPETGHTANPYRLCQRLASYFRQLGGQFLQQEVQAVQLTDQGCRLRLADGDWQLPQLLLTTGAWSKPFVQQLTGRSLPLDTERGYHLMLPAAADQLRIPVTSAERCFIMTPMEEGLRLAGTVEFGGLHKPANMKRAEMLLLHARALLPTVDERPGERWMGFRPSLPDSLPVIDRAGPRGQVLLAFGHQHLGLTQAALTAELVLALQQQKAPAVDLSPFRLGRFS
ncbi:NAD(P)/FAD-dependent oxidoreductase [Marinobacterium arenosum]|uniref:NAD(P)/FAD-dependent oxidoreductase n=1 Tax=Marinobacterium arenosum TaxID=2862496 RepID=UPI001C972288|nr:FAD-dependent oxidoreductase [Marinobacterium arenosum]MBY4675629.1 FAD-binding oxidoreductase [Marinobacterium arenosum]